MPIIENLKNFIRNGKGARYDEEDPRYDQHAIHHHTDPLPQAAYTAKKVNNSTMGDNENRAAQIANVAAHEQQKHQHVNPSQDRNDRTDAIARIVAEESEQKGSLPKYPGLEKYALIEKMGDGAFSNVYKARTQDGEKVAIKVVRKYELSKSQNNNHLHEKVRKKPAGVERANILKEVQIMRTLNHPNIIKLIEFTESKDYYFLVLELATGGELFHQIVRLTYFSEDLSRHVIKQVADALLYLHDEKGVVHRDIKPENILFEPIPFVPSKKRNLRATDEEDKEDEGEFLRGVGAGGIGRIKIADFGLSKVVWESQTQTPCGTVGYTAPEIVKNERYSTSVDMWALGCVLYTLLCGFPPFYDESIQQLTEKVARGQYTFLSPWWDEISKSAQDLISHLLTVDPERRYTIEQFLNHPWIKGTDEDTVPAFDAPPTGYKPNQKEYWQNVNEEKTAFPQGLQTPGIPETPGRAFRSPGVVTLREVFDVSYAVHRMEEENARRKNAKHANYKAANNLNAMDEGSDEEETPVQVQQAKRTHGGVGEIERDLRKAALDNNARRGGTAKKAGFELDMNKATLLGRRKHA